METKEKLKILSTLFHFIFFSFNAPEFGPIHKKILCQKYNSFTISTNYLNMLYILSFIHFFKHDKKDTANIARVQDFEMCKEKNNRL